MKYKLHYAALELDGDIPCYSFNSQAKLINTILGFEDHKRMVSNLRNPNEVYLCAIENAPHDFDGTILVDHKPEQIISFIKDHTNTPTMKNIFLQVYSSYEEAYNVALNMKSSNHLCYDKECSEVEIKAR